MRVRTAKTLPHFPHSIFFALHYYVACFSVLLSSSALLVQAPSRCNLNNMDYKRPESFKPVLDSDLAPELRRTLYSFFNDSMGGECEYSGCCLLPSRVKKEVSAHPILARAMCSDDRMSLLEFLCEHADCNYEDTIQFLIEANPHALLSHVTMVVV